MKLKKYFSIICAIILIFPVVYICADIISALAHAHPLRSTSKPPEWRENFFLKHYQNNAHHITSMFVPKTSKEVAYFLLKQSQKYPYDHKNRHILYDAAHDIFASLYRHYPFDVELTFRKTIHLWHNKQYVQSYNILNTSYDIAPCYKAAINYRILLQKTIGLFVLNKIDIDQKNLNKNHCLSNS